MALCLITHSIIIVFILTLYSRWMDEETLADICLYSLVVELAVAAFNLKYLFYTDTVFFLQVGNILPETFFSHIQLMLCFDELSGFFFAILDFALILCFFFLIEYFEYDSNSTGIILLSSLFSHLAIWYFCVFDLFLLVLFWEGISMVSFLLIQHWSFRLPSYKAGIKVFVISQVGDLPLFGFVFLLINRFGTTDMGEILGSAPLTAFEYVTVLFGTTAVSLPGTLAVLASFAMLLKSAQFFFYPWLLDAMEAPVPISAQLHSSTLVIIGFYVFLRFQNFAALAPQSGTLLLAFGVVTVVGASVLGFFQEDGKKLLACSTASQLGYAVTGLGLGFFEESMLLMLFCCCNKAFTFIWFGSLMDRHAGVSDFRFISGFTSVSTLEHAGLAVSVANFTVFPGAFSWHVKALFLKGESGLETVLAKYSLDILNLTWFFSSLYLVYLYVALFLKPNRAVSRRRGAVFFSDRTISLNTKLRIATVKASSQVNTFFANALTPLAPHRMTWGFFCLLLFSACVLLSPTNLSFFNVLDVSWVGDYFMTNNFVFNNFYA